ncbi:MAG: MaoC/PaaZ C-terminal domain-containing protein [Pseudomonadales bacterium]
MPLHTKMVGRSTQAITHTVDARWIMAYAAALGDFNPRYMDTQAHEVTAHPVFPVCLEWPVILSSRTVPGYESVTAAESARGVHAAHDLHILRPIVAGEVLTTQATIIGLRRIKPGAAQLSRLDTVDAAGMLVSRTYQLGISRDVEVIGEAAASEEPPPLPACARPWPQTQRFAIPVAEGAAHVYTECARIWNPIHTDRAVALRAGLPDIILHGTATMALAVGRLVDEYLGGDPTRVRRLGGRFTAMVLMPSTLTLEVLGEENGTLFFEVLTEEGRSAFSGGFLVQAQD